MQQPTEIASRSLRSFRSVLHDRCPGQHDIVDEISGALFRRLSADRGDRPIATFVLADAFSRLRKRTRRFGKQLKLCLSLANALRVATIVEYMSADRPSSAADVAERIRAKPDAIVVLVELEEAHPGVVAGFKSAWERGFLLDRDGNEVSCRSAIIVLVTDGGAEEFAELATVNDRDVLNRSSLQLLRKSGFPREILEHVDGVFLP
ncbi:AAA family ATPase [Bosea beijingensis]|uniref:AAA family ATPase n=1 Tax=Bosea beijingensis TaxID=3068632 RepID=UPI002741846F|nr:AAA family ATPase [Bosea sp. REN20]